MTGVAYIIGLKNCHKMQLGGSGVEVRLEACDGVNRLGRVKLGKKEKSLARSFV